MSNWFWLIHLLLASAPNRFVTLFHRQLVLKLDGSEPIFVTHQLDMSWLNELAFQTYNSYQ